MACRRICLFSNNQQSAGPIELLNRKPLNIYPGQSTVCRTVVMMCDRVRKTFFVAV